MNLRKGEEIAQMEPLLEEVAVAATVQNKAGVEEDQQRIIKELVAQASSKLYNHWRTGTAVCYSPRVRRRFFGQTR